GTRYKWKVESGKNVGRKSAASSGKESAGLQKTTGM
ncbi:MAG: hypothetical protein ACI934_001088, partial [Pseudohongiellaceae bacterium]